jgi:HEAT repeat protein
VLDVPAFLEASAGLGDRYRLHNVPTILDQHPDPAAYLFYLDQMRWIADNWEGFETRYLIDPARALDSVIERLLAFEDPERLAVTRDAIDELYQAGTLDERRYIRTSSRLNELLGDESAVFIEMEERQRIARETEVQRRRDEEAAQWRLVVDENTSPEGIRANLRSLDTGGSASKRASSWLVIAWGETLPPAHEMLADPDVSDVAKFRLLQVLGEIGDGRSIAPVIGFIRTNADDRAHLGAGLRALALMPTTAATFAFAGELLGEDESPLMRQQALIYLAAVRDRRGAAFARRYSAADIEPEVQVGGLLLAARLGDRKMLPAIVELLETTEDRSYREVLVRALGELSTPESLNAFAETSPSYGGAASFRDIQQLVEFRHAEGDRKLELARRVIEKGHPWDRREAVRFLVDGRHTELLFGYLQLGPNLGLPLLKTVVVSPGGIPIFAQIRRMGYRVEEIPEGLELVRDE